jgi:hypothetical protein
VAATLRLRPLESLDGLGAKVAEAPVATAHGDADGGRQLDPQQAVVEGTRHPCEQLLDHRQRRLGIGQVIDHHGEVGRADPRQGVAAPQRTAHAARRLAHDALAALAVHVGADELEVVQRQREVAHLPRCRRARRVATSSRSSTTSSVGSPVPASTPANDERRRGLGSLTSRTTPCTATMPASCATQLTEAKSSTVVISPPERRTR